MKSKYFNPYQSSLESDISEWSDIVHFIINQNDRYETIYWNSSPIRLPRYLYNSYKRIVKVIIDESIIQKLGVNDNITTFVEQELTNDGIWIRVNKLE